MCPKLGGPKTGDVSPNNDISIILTDISDSDFVSDESFVSETMIERNDDVSLLQEETSFIPLEHNIGELLMQTTNTEDLTTVTQVKLRVISREVALQNLNFYTPALRELTLDGSMIASLRDIGDSLKNLRILRVNRCGLVCIDGVFGFENLEELYAVDNTISSLAPCAFLVNLRILDVRRNCLHGRDITYLKLCENLKELFIEGNPRLDIHSRCPEWLRVTLPKLRTLNGCPLVLTADENGPMEPDDMENSRLIIVS